jgi:hypothetical protein
LTSGLKTVSQLSTTAERQTDMANSPQNITPTGGDAQLAAFSKSVAKGRTPSYGTITRVKKDLTNPHFGKGDAGTDTGDRREVEFNEGGKGKPNHMFPDQPATEKTRGHVGPAEVSDKPIDNLNRKSSEPANLGGPKLRYVGGGAAPQVPGRVGGSVGIDADKSIRGR